MILLRTDRLRKSPYKDSVQALLEALPDYRTLLAGTGLSPLDDFDALLIATANPFDVTATFLAARHRADPRIHKALAQRIMPTWDPRTIRYLTPTLSVLTRPDGAGRIDAVAAPGYPLPAPPVPSPSGADGGVDETARWLDDLARFDRIAGEDGGPSMMVTVSDLASLLHLQQGLPTPLDGSLAATADPNPALRLRMTFTDEGEATLFEAEWPAIVKRWRASALLLGLGGMLDGLTVKREGVVLEVSGRIAGTQVALALSWAKALLPRAREAAATDDPADGGTLQTDGAKAPVDSGGG
ncbi:MAG: hypothetical protein EXR72_01745 [Myxococcales bacterium]|nr:hypothetical protein [Myxococcales bacterium]